MHRVGRETANLGNTYTAETYREQAGTGEERVSRRIVEPSSNVLS